QSWHDTYGQIVATGQSMRFVKEARGLGRWFDVYAFRLGEPEDGKVAVLFTDVTERRRSAEELKQARSRLVSTLSAAEIGTWEFDPIHDVVQADENLRKMFGVSREEAQGGALAVYTRAIHPDDVGQVESAIKAALEGDEDYEINYRLLSPGGGVRHVVARGRVERDADGLAVRLPGVVIDVTAERLAEEQLQASEIRRRLALDAAELGAWNIDPQTNTLTTDLRFRQIFSDTTAPISYTQAFELVHPDDRERVRQAIAAATDPQNPQPYSIEYRVVHPSGAMRWIFAQGRSHFEATPVGRKLVSFDGTIVDITERKKAEQDLQQLAANLAETDRRKDEFLATLAHELRNPLAPIKTAAQLMQLEGDEPEKLRELSLVIDRQVKQMVRLIDDLLDISRISRGKIKLQSHPCDLRDVVSVALEAAQPFIASSGQTLQVDVDGQPLWVNGDAARLAQIMINLLNNAAKYTPPAGKIWLSVVPDGDQVVLKVRDDGIGLPQSQLSNIFAMFEQVDVSKERGQSGLGIGLALVKTFVELHGGSVEAHSDGLGCGCEFRVRLPRLLDPPPSSLSDKHSLESSTSESKVHPDRGPLKILVVEDTRMIRYTLVRLLKVMGHEVMEARDGREGLDIALSFRPDVLFSDISMPHMNGHELASKIRGMESMRAVRLVALTGFGQEADRQLAFQSGFDHHLVKPVDAGVLAQFFEDLRRTAP
ncbi:MAG: PAS domain-containing protein, partial [Planctomycetales bacterium]|nr:PAS domain-containing protein [Planctomycetales bacterium]